MVITINVNDVINAIKILFFVLASILTIYTLKEVFVEIKFRMEQNDKIIVEDMDKIKCLTENNFSYVDKRQIDSNIQRDEKVFDLQLRLLEEAHQETREMRNSNIELFKWKIGSLITITGLFFSLAKFL